jgi:carbon monoxide dehydrogenase subunit G
MEMQGSRVLAVTQQQAWDALLDPQVLQACIPGCERMESTGPNQYTAALALRIGPVAAKFNGKVALADVNPPQSCTISFDGQGGAAGFGKGSAKVRLAPKDAGCELSYDVSAQVGGKIAQVGQRLIDSVAKSMAEDFFKRFDAQMQRLHPAPVAAAQSAPAASATASTAPARSGVPPWVWVVGAVVLIGVAWMLMRS